MTPAPSPDDPLGYDAYVREDMTEDGRDASGEELAANAIYHRLTTEKQWLVGAPGAASDEESLVDYGINVFDWLGEPLTQESLNAKVPLVAAVVQRENVLDPATITVDMALLPATPPNVSFRVTVRARTTRSFPVELVMDVGAVTVDLLAQGR